MTGTISICSCYAYALFAHGAMLSFVSTSFARKNSLYVGNLLNDLCIVSLMGLVKTVNHLAPTCFILIGGHKLVTDLRLMELGDYEVVLGFDWFMSV